MFRLSFRDVIIIIHKFFIALFSDPKTLTLNTKREMTIRGDKRKTAKQRTEARWSVIVDRDKGCFGRS